LGWKKGGTDTETSLFGRKQKWKEGRTGHYFLGFGKISKEEGRTEENSLVGAGISRETARKKTKKKKTETPKNGLTRNSLSKILGSGGG